MSSNSCLIPLFLFLSALSTSLFVCATYPYDQLGFSATADSPKHRAEKLIRQLNLFPKHAINMAMGGETPAAAEESLVEKQFRFPVLGGPSPPVEDLAHHAGYYRLPHTKAARMFYFFFESQNSEKDPVVIWLTGGPGCSSELALFYENGPFQIADNMSLVWNNYSWDKASNLIFVDQPTGTGFSYTTDESDIRHDETGVSNDLYDFLQEFFKKHHGLANNDFYITGESYAGHYIPALASRVQQGNKIREGIQIKLKGFAIGNGLTNPAIQYQAYTDYALENKLIQLSDYERINKILPDCEQAIKACGTDGASACDNAFYTCTNVFNAIMIVAGDINYYDIRKKCEGNLCYNLSNMEGFLNENTVRDALGVGNREFVSCSSEVYDAMQRDWMRNLEVGIPTLLEDGISVLIYAGDQDLICNWLGNSRWVHAMEWSGQKEFGAASVVPFTVEGTEAGELKSHGPLSFLKVHKAGHMVPMDQPKAALQMLTSWMQGKLAMTGNEDMVAPK